MGERKRPTRIQARVGILVVGMAMAIAVAPLGLALAFRNSTTPATPLLVAGALWVAAVVPYWALARAHERWRRKQLRREIAVARRARLNSGEAYQDHLINQSAMLERITSISDSLLSEGITDPRAALDKIRLIGTHAHQAQGLVDDAVAEVRLETGAQEFRLEPVDVRSELEHVAGPFIRSGKAITTAGTQHFAHTDAAVLRLVIRALVNRALDSGAGEIDITVARNGALVVCMVADNGRDRSNVGIDDLPVLPKSLVAAVAGELGYGRALGWNQYSLSLPVGIAPPHVRRQGSPMDVLGSVAPSQPIEASRVARPSPTKDTSDTVDFAEPIDRENLQTVAARLQTDTADRGAATPAR